MKALLNSSFLIYILFLSCNEAKNEYHYKSSDWATGGFVEYKLDFIKNGKCHFELIRQIANEGDSLSSWRPETVLMDGNWHEAKGKIFFRFNNFQKNIENAFLKNKFVTSGLELNLNNEFVMDKTTDTLFIDNIPCLKLPEGKN